MEAVITGENQERAGVNLRDNSGTEHVLEMEFDGEIKYHEQDGYPDDPPKRTPAEGRNVNEARRYAKYHVYRERGYDTLLEGENPDRLALVALAIASLSDDALLDHFGDLYKQIKSHYGGDDRPLAWPDGFGEENPAIYMQDVYLDLDPDAIDAVAEAMADESAFELLADVPDLASRGQTRGFGDVPAIASVADAHGLTDAGGHPRPLDQWIEGVSGLHLKWRDRTDSGNLFEMGEAPDLDRAYDARLQIRPFDPADLEEFRNALVWSLKCQIRDCFVGYGRSPPEGVRVTGPGNDDWTVTYMQLDIFQDFHDPDAEVGWDLEGWPDRVAEEDDDGGLF